MVSVFIYFVIFTPISTWSPQALLFSISSFLLFAFRRVTWREEVLVKKVMAPAVLWSQKRCYMVCHFTFFPKSGCSLTWRCRWSRGGMWHVTELVADDSFLKLGYWVTQCPAGDIFSIETCQTTKTALRRGNELIFLLNCLAVSQYSGIGFAQCAT